ncbi:MAG: MBL fold metallo-hydrolase [Leptospirales bacterium]|nr:MBL fold metallo-hydrolase [Leptospirales bacterium]
MKLKLFGPLLAAASLLGALQCSSVSPLERSTPPAVVRINTGVANVYLVRGERPILIDTSVPDKLEVVLDGLRQSGVEPASLALVIVTHGHGDHAGSGRYFHDLGVPVAGGVGDLDKFTSGHTDLGKAVSIGLMARILRPMSDGDYPGFQPDVVIKDVVDLHPYGLEGNIIPLPGHTPGSVVVRTGDALFAGDLIRGGIFANETPTEHFYHENRQQAREQLGKIMNDQINMIYPGHFGPLQAQAIREYLAEQ